MSPETIQKLIILQKMPRIFDMALRTWDLKEENQEQAIRFFIMMTGLTEMIEPRFSREHLTDIEGELTSLLNFKLPDDDNEYFIFGVINDENKLSICLGVKQINPLYLAMMN